MRLAGSRLICFILGLIANAWPVSAAAQPEYPRVLAAGDIATCDSPTFLERAGYYLDHIVGQKPEPLEPHAPTGALSTARLLDEEPGLVLPLGDLAYTRGTLDQFQRCYEPSWGRHFQRTRPVPGNHEYKTPDAAGYFAYWGDRAGENGKGYYSFDYGQWFMVAINSEIDISKSSNQLVWLRKELAATPRRCILAYYHRPRFASGQHGDNPRLQDLFETLHAYGVSVVLNGHEHHYERLTPLDPEGRPDPGRGVRPFVVGTGGGFLRRARPSANTVALNTDNWGVLRLELRPESYRWTFLPAQDLGFSDSGEATCIDRARFGLIGGVAGDESEN